MTNATQQELQAKATWNASPAIRAEFGKFETYLAYTKANHAGAIKVYKAAAGLQRIPLAGNAVNRTHNKN